MFDDTLDSLLSQQAKNNFINPFYERYCISNIPNIILDFFDIKQKITHSWVDESFKEKSVNRIVLFVLVGFGLNRFIFI